MKKPTMTTPPFLCCWEELRKEFGIVPFSSLPKEFREIAKPTNSFGVIQIKDSTQSGQDSSGRFTIIIYSHLLMTVTVFPDVDDAMYDAILVMKMREIKKDNSTQQ